MSVTDLNETRPPLGCYYHVSLGTDISGMFSSVSGLNFELEVETYQEGGLNTGVRFFPTVPMPQRLVLERGIVAEDVSVRWLMATQLGTFNKMEGTITLLDDQGKRQNMWRILDAYPIRYEGPALSAMESKVAISRVEIMHTGVLPVYEAKA